MGHVEVCGRDHVHPTSLKRGDRAYVTTGAHLKLYSYLDALMRGPSAIPILYSTYKNASGHEVRRQVGRYDPTSYVPTSTLRSLRVGAQRTARTGL